MEQIQLTQADYQILKKTFSEADQHTQANLLQLSCWQSADLSASEIHFGNTYLDGDKMYYIDKALRYKHVSKQPAGAGDIVLIISDSTTFDSGCVGRCFRVYSRWADYCGESHAVIMASDTFTEQTHTYLIMLHDEQYLVLEQGD